eukprot:187978-Amphidinium_carterae.1
MPVSHVFPFTNCVPLVTMRCCASASGGSRSVESRVKLNLKSVHCQRASAHQSKTRFLEGFNPCGRLVVCWATSQGVACGLSST